MTRALLFVSLLLTLPSLGLAQQRERAREPFLRLCIDSKDQLAANPQLGILWRALRSAVAEHAEPQVAAVLADGEQLWSQLQFPLELFAILESADRFTVGLFTPTASSDLLPPLQRMGLPGTSKTVAAGGASFAVLDMHRQGTLIEGETDGRHLLLFDSTVTDPIASVRRFTTAIQPTSPGTRRLQRNLDGAGIALSLNLEVLLGGYPQKARGELGIIKTILGPRFAGMAVRLLPQPDHLVIDWFVDIVPGQGLLGGLLPRDEEGTGLLGWVPEDSEEFFSLRLSTKGIVEVLRFAAGFGVSMDPGDWGEAFERLRGTDIPGLLEQHLNGEVLGLTVPTAAEDALDTEAPIPMVMLLGTADGKQALQEFRQLLDQYDGGFDLAADAAFGDDVYTLKVAGEVLCRVAVRQGFLAFADTDEKSVAMLRSMLATEGKAGLPAIYRGRMQPQQTGTMPMLVGASHLLSNIQGFLIARELTDRSAPMQMLQAAVALIQREFPGERGMQATRVVADKQGLWVRNVW